MGDDRNDQIDFLQPETIKALCKKAMTDYDEAAAELTRLRERNAELEKDLDEHKLASTFNEAQLARANARLTSLEATARELREALSLAECVYRKNAVAVGEPSSVLDAMQAALASSESVIGKSEGEKDGE